MKRDSWTLRTWVMIAVSAIVLMLLSIPMSWQARARGGQSGSGESSSNFNKSTSKKTPKKATPKRTTTPPKKSSRAASTPRQAPQIEMVLIPAGTFTMGSPDSEGWRDKSEGPQHRVTVQSFYMGKYEVTQAQWRAVMRWNLSGFKGDNRPVEQVSWNDATEFCRKLSQMTGKDYRLPTEAEWEYAARAGTTTPFTFGASLSFEQANFRPFQGEKGVFRQQTMSVGSFSPNGFGLYDMYGNVEEWCADYWHEHYNGAPTDGSAWLSGRDLNQRVLRGGSWGDFNHDCRSAARSKQEPHIQYYLDFVGFRVVLGTRT